MNRPADPQSDASLEPRIARLETTCEYLVAELREFRAEMRAFRAEMREEQMDLRRTTTADFRILFGAIIATTLGLTGVMAHGFGWI